MVLTKTSFSGNHIKLLSKSSSMNTWTISGSCFMCPCYVHVFNFCNRVGLVKTTSQQYVLEHCPVTGVVFTSGCDGSILSFAIETTISSDNEQQQYVLATATPIGRLASKLARHGRGSCRHSSKRK